MIAIFQIFLITIFCVDQYGMMFVFTPAHTLAVT